MRTISKSLLGIIVIAGAMALTSCKGKQKKEEPQVSGETVINMHCFGSDYFSSKKHLRASGLGESMDRMTAIKKARNEAKTGLASSVETTIKATIENSKQMVEYKDRISKNEQTIRELVFQSIELSQNKEQQFKFRK